jgi:hypothetical protein
MRIPDVYDPGAAMTSLSRSSAARRLARALSRYCSFVGQLGFEHRDHRPCLFNRALRLLPCHDLLSQFLPRRVQSVRAAGIIVVDHNNRNPPSRTRWPDVDSVRYCLAKGNHF